MEDTTFKRFCARLQELMDEQGTNPRAVSMHAGLNQTFVRDMLERQKSPSIENAAALAKALGSTLSEMIRMKGETPAQDLVDDMRPDARRVVMEYLRRMAKEPGRSDEPFS